MDDFLGTHLRDQLALGVAWREVARRAQRDNRGTDLADALARVSTGIAEDVETFRSIMRRLGARANPVKTGLAVIAERLGRLKLNGRLKQLWTTLRDLAGLEARLPDIDFDHLVDRAARRRADLELFRVQAGREAFAPPSTSPGRS
ncbi:hypothetical protein ACRAKI_22715 [Saccharothrix isguenensis]